VGKWKRQLEDSYSDFVIVNCAVLMFYERFGIMIENLLNDWYL